MPSIQVKDVPVEVHAVLRRRAATDGKSLQEYLLARWVEEASRPTLNEILDRIEHRSGGEAHLKTTTQAVRLDRDAR